MRYHLPGPLLCPQKIYQRVERPKLVVQSAVLRLARRICGPCGAPADVRVPFRAQLRPASVAGETEGTLNLCSCLFCIVGYILLFRGRFDTDTLGVRLYCQTWHFGPLLLIGCALSYPRERSENSTDVWSAVYGAGLAVALGERAGRRSLRLPQAGVSRCVLHGPTTCRLFIFRLIKSCDRRGDADSLG